MNNLEKLVCCLATEPNVETKFKQDPEATLKEFGFSDEESEKVVSADSEYLNRVLGPQQSFIKLMILGEKA